MLVRMSVAGLRVHPATGCPVVLLADEAGVTILAIGIGTAEAHSIAVQLEQIRLARPLTHDLFLTTLGVLDAEVMRVEIHNLVDETFHATLVVRRGDQTREVDSRPSDAIAIAMRAGAPIFVAQAVFEAATAPLGGSGRLGAKGPWSQVIEALPKTAYGKYKH